jgi:hypothetical protein
LLKPPLAELVRSLSSRITHDNSGCRRLLAMAWHD